MSTSVLDETQSKQHTKGWRPDLHSRGVILEQ